MATLLLSIAHCGSLYGANRSLFDLLSNISRDDFSPMVVFLEDGPALERFARAGIPILLFPSGLSSHASEGSWTRWSFDAASYSLRWFVLASLGQLSRRTRLRNLRQALPASGPVIVHSNSSVTDIGWHLSKMLRCPHVWHLREYGIEDYGLHPDFGYRWLATLMRRSHARVAISRNLRGYFFSDESPEEACHVVYNGVRHCADFVEGFRRRRKPSNIQSGRVKFIMVGSLHRSKGHEMALCAFARACAQMGEAVLEIVGDGGARVPLEKLVLQLGLVGRVRFHGYQDDISERLIDADIALMCSEREAMGRVTAEAMGFGVPVIGRASGGTSELIAHKENGLLYDGSISDLTSKMVELALDRELRSAMSIACHQEALDRFSIENYVDQMTCIFHDSISSFRSF